MSNACKTTNIPNVVVCSKEKGVELMGMDMQTDPYAVESEMEDDGLFGDAAAANNHPAASAPDGDDASDVADSPDAETAEARFLPSPLRTYPISSRRPACLRAHPFPQLVQ